VTNSKRRGREQNQDSRPFAFVQVLPGFTAEAYGHVISALGPEPMDGLVAHLAGPCPDGWRIIQVWCTAGHHARFERDRLWPALAEAGAFAATSSAPLVERLELSHVLLADRLTRHYDDL
jgi:hypothetical protein